MPLAVLGWILLAQTCGGITPALTKLALTGFEPWTLVAGRQLIGLFVLWAMARAAGPLPSLRHVTGRDWALFVCLSWAGFALPQILLAFGLELATAITGALLAPLEPIAILFGGALLLGERLTAARLAAIALGIAGASLIVLQSEFESGQGSLFGDGLVAVGHAAWAIYTLAAKPLLRRHAPVIVSMMAAGLTIPPLVPLAAAEPLDPDRALAALGWLVLLAFVATAVTSYAWNRALQSISAGTMAAFIFVQPVVGLLVGGLFLGEPVPLQALVGAAVIVAGVLVAATRGEVE
jgi:drug/metabolite transporter (DMT)-like permease